MLFHVMFLDVACNVGQGLQVCT